MRNSVKIAVALYLLAMVGCLAAFFVQQSVVYTDHIRPGLARSHMPIAVTLEDKATGDTRHAEITLVNDSLATNPPRMGNEIEEHLLSLLAANLATGVMLVFLLISGFRNVQPATAGNT
jgi:hypothetical protein